MKHLLKKAFLLLALVGGVNSVWASTVDDLTRITAATTFTMDGLNGTSGLVDKTLYADGKLLCLGGCGYSEAKGSTTYDETTYKNVYQIKSNRQIALKIGFKATITIVGQSHSSRTWRLGTSSGGNDIAESAVNTTTLSANVDGSSTAQVVYINASSDLYLGAIIITSNDSSTPTISAKSPVSIKATESGVEVTEEIGVAGENLTGSTLTATISPAVDGLSVTLGSSSITDGAISTTATLHYTKTANASGSTTLTLSDGTTSKDVTVNYKSLVVPTELVAVSNTEPTSFDLSKVGTGHETIAVEDGYVVLTDAGSEVSFADNLAVAAINGVGVTWRGDAVQGPLFKFKTTVPGCVTVKFSDVGSSGDRAKRYANVNGTRTDVYSTTSASGGVVTSSPIAVSAGEVIIKGQVAGDGDTYTDNQIRVFTISFTPAVSTTITSAGYATFSSEYAVSIPVGVEAYAAKLEGDKVTLTQVDEVPANTGVVLKAAEGVYDLPVVASADAIDTDLKVSDGSVTGDESNIYVLGDGKYGIGFYKLANGNTLEAGKAYLLIGGGARGFIGFEGATGINEVNVNKAAAKTGKIYNLNGQIVSKPSKGLFIVDGKVVSF